MMIAELHLHQLGGIPPQELQPESYYAVDYINKFYIGRLLAIRDGVLHFKFLHSNQCTGSMEFYWPRRDDMDTVSPYCVFYCPVNLNGNGPFTVNNLKEIVNLFCFIKRQGTNICVGTVLKSKGLQTVLRLFLISLVFNSIINFLGKNYLYYFYM